MDFTEILKEKLQIKDEITLKKTVYELETEVGQFEISIYFKGKIIEINLYKEKHDVSLIRSIYQSIEDSLNETINKNIEYKVTTKDIDLHHILGDFHDYIKSSISVNDKYLEQSVDILSHHGLAIRPWLSLKESEHIKTINDLVNMTEYEFLSLAHSGEPSLRNLKETLRKLW